MEIENFFLFQNEEPIIPATSNTEQKNFKNEINNQMFKIDFVRQYLNILLLLIQTFNIKNFIISKKDFKNITFFNIAIKICKQLFYTDVNFKMIEMFEAFQNSETLDKTQKYIFFSDLFREDKSKIFQFGDGNIFCFKTDQYFSGQNIYPPFDRQKKTFCVLQNYNQVKTLQRHFPISEKIQKLRDQQNYHNIKFDYSSYFEFKIISNFYKDQIFDEQVIIDIMNKITQNINSNYRNLKNISENKQEQKDREQNQKKEQNSNKKLSKYLNRKEEAISKIFIVQSSLKILQYDVIFKFPEIQKNKKAEIIFDLVSDQLQNILIHFYGETSVFVLKLDEFKKFTFLNKDLNFYCNQPIKILDYLDINEDYFKRVIFLDIKDDKSNIEQKELPQIQRFQFLFQYFKHNQKEKKEIKNLKKIQKIVLNFYQGKMNFNIIKPKTIQFGFFDLFKYNLMMQSEKFDVFRDKNQRKVLKLIEN